METISRTEPGPTPPQISSPACPGKHAKSAPSFAGRLYRILRRADACARVVAGSRWLTAADKSRRVCFPKAVVLLNVGTSPLRPPTLRDGRPEKTRPSPALFVGPLPKCEQGSSRGRAGCLPVCTSSRRLMGRSAFKDFSRVHLLGEASGVSRQFPRSMARAFDQPTQRESPLLMVKLRMLNWPLRSPTGAATRLPPQMRQRGLSDCDCVQTGKLPGKEDRSFPFPPAECLGLFPGGRASDGALHVNVQ